MPKIDIQIARHIIELNDEKMKYIQVNNISSSFESIRINSFEDYKTLIDKLNKYLPIVEDHFKTK